MKKVKAKKCNCCGSRAKRSGLCWPCYNKRTKKRNPVSFAYHILKANAKRRGKTFTLTVEQFKMFCIKTNYLKGKGRSSEGYTIDRIDESKGYSIDNIQVLTNKENTKKYFLQYDWRTKQASVLKPAGKNNNNSQDDLPF